METVKHHLGTKIEKENVVKSKLINLPGKQGLSLKSNNIITQRPAFGELTNANAGKAKAFKPAVKKKVTVTVPDKKVTVTVPEKEFLPVKPSVLPVKAVKKSKETGGVIIKKPTIKTTNAYSLQYFGLIEENDTDPLLVPNYINEIIAYLRELELKYVVKNKFLVTNKTTPRMRSVLINWLVDVHLNFKMVQETLYLCVSIIDRFLSKTNSIGRDNLQLVGIAALLIASKYEEIYSPPLEDLVYICEEMFSKRKIILMEQLILKTLNFSIGGPCALHFLRRYSKLGEVSEDHHLLAKYMLESSLLEDEFSCVKPSLIAATASCLSVQLLNKSDKKCHILSMIHHVSGYDESDIGPVMKNLASLVYRMNSSKYEAVKNKYSKRSNSIISKRIELKEGLIKKIADIEK